jgi:hypothetical protein
MSKLSSAQVNETQVMTFCVYAEEYRYVTLNLDGEELYRGDNRNSGGSYYQKCIAPREVKTGFHFIQASVMQRYADGESIKITSAKCKDDAERSTVVCNDAGNNCARSPDCEPQEEIKPKMSWPPVCGDAVKFKMDTSSADAVSYGTLGNTDKKPWA